MKVAFVFPGQGSQYVGMGKDLHGNFEEVRKIYNEASNSLGYDIAKLSFNGPQEELNKTIRTQPALLTASFSAYKIIFSKGITPFCMAGHSLGEYSAVVAAGVIPFKAAIEVTEKRGRYMQEAVSEGKGLMAAILGLERSEVDEICKSISSGYVSPANYNCPGQIVVAGEKTAVEKAMKRAEDAGAKRAMPLSVSVPSHCKLMEEASKKLSALFEGVELSPAKIPIVNNADAVFLKQPDEIKKSLIKQLSTPLLWEDSVQIMIKNGVDTFIEVGPKKVLSGLIKRISKDVRVLNVEDTKTLTETVNALT
jgi:[acyl-carrier-protein] S-malonyltransferase